MVVAVAATATAMMSNSTAGNSDQKHASASIRAVRCAMDSSASRWVPGSRPYCRVNSLTAANCTLPARRRGTVSTGWPGCCPWPAPHLRACAAQLHAPPCQPRGKPCEFHPDCATMQSVRAGINGKLRHTCGHRTAAIRAPRCGHVFPTLSLAPRPAAVPHRGGASSHKWSSEQRTARHPLGQCT